MNEPDRWNTLPGRIISLFLKGLVVLFISPVVFMLFMAIGSFGPSDDEDSKQKPRIRATPEERLQAAGIAVCHGKPHDHSFLYDGQTRFCSKIPKTRQHNAEMASVMRGRIDDCHVWLNYCASGNQTACRAFCSGWIRRCGTVMTGTMKFEKALSLFC